MAILTGTVSGPLDLTSTLGQGISLISNFISNATQSGANLVRTQLEQERNAQQERQAQQTRIDKLASDQRQEDLQRQQLNQFAVSTIIAVDNNAEKNSIDRERNSISRLAGENEASRFQLERDRQDAGIRRAEAEIRRKEDAASAIEAQVLRQTGDPFAASASRGAILQGLSPASVGVDIPTGLKRQDQDLGIEQAAAIARGDTSTADSIQAQRNALLGKDQVDVVSTRQADLYLQQASSADRQLSAIDSQILKASAEGLSVPQDLVDRKEQLRILSDGYRSRAESLIGPSRDLLDPSTPPRATPVTSSSASPIASASAATPPPSTPEASVAAPSAVAAAASPATTEDAPQVIILRAVGQGKPGEVAPLLEATLKKDPKGFSNTWWTSAKGIAESLISNYIQTNKLDPVTDRKTAISELKKLQEGYLAREELAASSEFGRGASDRPTSSPAPVPLLSPTATEFFSSQASRAVNGAGSAAGKGRGSNGFDFIDVLDSLASDLEVKSRTPLQKKQDEITKQLIGK